MENYPTSMSVGLGMPPFTVWQRISLREGIEILNLSSDVVASLKVSGISSIYDLLTIRKSDIQQRIHLSISEIYDIYVQLARYCQSHQLDFPQDLLGQEEVAGETVPVEPDQAKWAQMPLLETWMAMDSPTATPDLATSPGLNLLGENKIGNRRARKTKRTKHRTHSNRKQHDMQIPIRSIPENRKDKASELDLLVAFPQYELKTQASALAQGIEILNLSIRAYNTLRRAGIDYIYDLITRTVQDLEVIRNMGSRTLTEVLSKLQYYLGAKGISQQDIDAIQSWFENVRTSSGSLNKSITPIIHDPPQTEIWNTGHVMLATSDLLEMTLLQAVQHPNMTPESWAGFVVECKIKGCRNRIPEGISVYGRSVFPLDPRFLSSLSVRTFHALETVGIYDLASASKMKVRDLVGIRQFGRKATIELLGLITSEMANLKNDESVDSQQEYEASYASSPEIRLADSSPQQVQRLTLRQILTNEVQAKRLHPNVSWHQLTLGDWLDSGLEHAGDEELDRFLIRAERKLSHSSINSELRVVFEKLKPRHISVLMARFGEPSLTLQEIGEKLGVTRERVRQLEQRACKIIAKWLNSHPWRLETALLLAQEMGNQVSLQEWKSILHETGLLENKSIRVLGEESIECNVFEWILVLLKANEHAETPSQAFRIPKNLRSNMQYPELAAQEIKAARALSKQARRAIRRHTRNAGAVSATILGRKYKIVATVLSKALVFYDYIKLDQEWLSLKPEPAERITSHNSAFHVNVTKMLSHCGPLSVEEIRQGLQSHVSRFDMAAPPSSVLKKVLEMHGFALNSDNLVELPDDKETQASVNTGESLILDVLKRNGPVVNFLELSEEFSRKGYSQPLLTMTLRYSVLFHRVDSGLYALRGARITREEIEAAVARRPDVRQNGQLRYSSDGTITWEINIGVYGLGGTIPSGEAAKLSGEWQSHIDGVDTGRIKVGEQQIWGLAKCFRKLDVKVGDRIALFFNPESRLVQILKLGMENYEAE